MPMNRNGYTQMNVGSKLMMTKHFIKPKNANLTKTPLKKIEKLVEAST